MKEEQNVSLYIRTSRLKCAMLKAAKLKMRLQKKYRGFFITSASNKKGCAFCTGSSCWCEHPFLRKVDWRAPRQNQRTLRR